MPVKHNTRVLLNSIVGENVNKSRLSKSQVSGSKCSGTKPVPFLTGACKNFNPQYTNVYEELKFFQ